MGTPYSKVFNAYLSRVTDDLYGAMDVQELEIELIQVMEAALPRFPYPKTDIYDYDHETKQFNVDLSNAEIQIIASLMNLIWTEQKIHDIDLTRQIYGDNDFNKHGTQAFHLRALLDVKRELEIQVRRMMHTYGKVKNREPDFEGLAGGTRR